MNVAEERDLWTYEEFCDVVGDGQKADLIDGVIYVASPENIRANALFVWIISLLSSFVEQRNAGRVFGSRVALRLDRKNAPEPDVFFIKKARQHVIKRAHIAGPADLAMEIVSPESVERDYKKKRRQYQRFGITEYWIIDERKQRVLLLRLDRNGKYVRIPPKKGILHSEVLPGFWLRPEWLWQDPLPSVMSALAELLK